MKEIREAVQQARDVLARTGRSTILFVDEVHRFNKAQQDAFLPYVEQGLLTLRRRDDGEPVVRGELGAAFAGRGVRACSR